MVAYELKSEKIGKSKRHTHAEGDGFRISSSHRVEDVLTCELLDVPLFGPLGRYILPHDAVVEMDGCRTKQAFQDALTESKRAWVEKCTQHSIVNDVFHITLEKKHLMEWGDEEEEEFAEYEDETDEEEEDACVVEYEGEEGESDVEDK